MNTIYNKQSDIATNFKQFLLKICPNIKKTQLKIIPFIIFGIISSESSVASDIAKSLKDEFSLVQHDSVIRRIKRLLTNKFFNPYSFYDLIIKHVIFNYKKKHSDKRVHIIFDHMFSHDNFTVFMITMRVGKQGIPLWFRCFKGRSPSEAMQEQLIIDGISYVSNLFDNKYDLIFLADRWFNFSSILKHIDSLGHTYCIRFKKNFKILIYDKKEGHPVWKSLYEIKPYYHNSRRFNDILLFEEQYKTNLVISKSKYVSEPWIIITNGDTSRAIKDYSYRFGAVECLFKNQKSNGFYIECTYKSSLKYFESLYSLICVSTLFLTILGAEYSKNTKCYKNVKITTHKNINGIKRRVKSLFHTGLILFNKAFNSITYVRLPFSFILYDI